jgi:hypothetical protein
MDGCVRCLGLWWHVRVRIARPNGAATGLKRATSANSRPIIASPTNPSATEKLVQNPWSGWLAPITANTSGDTTTPIYAATQNTARVASVTTQQSLSSRSQYVISERPSRAAPASGRHDDVLHIGHVAIGGLDRVVGAAPVLT